MWYRLTVGVALVTLVSLVAAAPVLAGGWAITVFDPLPKEFQAGQTYRLGYTVLLQALLEYGEACSRRNGR